MRIDDATDCTFSHASVDTLHVRTIVDIEGQTTVVLEDWLRLHIRPKPKRMPEKLYRKILERLVYLARFKEEPHADPH